jgi:hypothetical protein
MLTIRNAQMRAFDPRGVFAQRLSRFAREELAGRAVEFTDVALRDACARGIDAAFDVGLDSEQDIARFVLVMLAAGADFDTRPAPAWALDALREGGGRALDGVVGRVVASLRAEGEGA